MNKRKVAAPAKPGKPQTVAVRFIGPGQIQDLNDMVAFVEWLNLEGPGGMFSVAGLSRDVILRFMREVKKDKTRTIAWLYGRQTDIFESELRKKEGEKQVKSPPKTPENGPIVAASGGVILRNPKGNGPKP